MNITKRRSFKSVISFLLCASVCCLAIYLVSAKARAIYTLAAPTNARDNSNPKAQAEMLRITLQVADVAPIPAGAKLVSVSTGGSSFTRSFRVKYSAPSSAIKKWLSSSKGIAKARMERTGKVTKYIVNAKMGYQYAEVVVDYETNTVSMYVYWS